MSLLLIGGEESLQGEERVSGEALRLDLAGPRGKITVEASGLELRGEGKIDRSRSQTSYRRDVYKSGGPRGPSQTLAAIVSKKDWFGELGF